MYCQRVIMNFFETSPQIAAHFRNWANNQHPLAFASGRQALLEKRLLADVVLRARGGEVEARALQIDVVFSKSSCICHVVYICNILKLQNLKEIANVCRISLITSTFFFGRRRLKGRSEKTEIVRPKRKQRKREKEGRGQASEEDETQPFPASSRNMLSLPRTCTQIVANL